MLEPEKLEKIPIPQTMDQAIALKELATGKLKEIEYDAVTLRGRKKRWKKQYETALKRISDIATAHRHTK